MKSKTTAALLAFFLGGVGVHKFYLGRPILGLFYLVFSWTFIPAFVAVIETILLLVMNEHDFNLRYNSKFISPAFAGNTNQNAQNIVVNVAAPAAASSGAVDVTQQIKALHDLKVAGALSEEEFSTQKTRLLASRLS